MEMADIILVNKADGDLKAQATRTCADYAGALRLLRKRPQDPEGFPKALTISALEADGLGKAWDEMQALAAWRRENGVWDATREAQAGYWFEEEVRRGILDLVLADPQVASALAKAKRAATMGHRPAALAAAEVIEVFGSRRPPRK
jgi:LAO/AO transport system kinase